MSKTNSAAAPSALAVAAIVSPRVTTAGHQVFSIGKTEVGHYHQVDFVVVGDDTVQMWTSLDGGEATLMDVLTEESAAGLFRATKAAGFRAVW